MSHMWFLHGDFSCVSGLNDAFLQYRDVKNDFL